MSYTIDDYKTAQDELARITERWDNYSGNNPNKYHSLLSEARFKVRVIEGSLKSQGVIPLSDKETLEKELDKNFPNARSKQVVEFEGKKYRKRFFPLEKSRSGKTVNEWGSCWEIV
ncbi:hypothetical protein [Serratia liquefaciens]|uniref:hypothetical protein n=1 Tax=Serratia liquefaciens TaxID=614 RepID=UPI0009632D02|nr:hypothetical protein [Serratia liquefaciens]OKP25456.1 hypothetical protein BSQ35_03000 [Serratia liquefaciens]